MNNVLSILNNFISSNKKMELVNINQIIINPIFGIDEIKIVSTGHKRLYKNSVKKEKTQKKELVMEENNCETKYEFNNIINYYNHTLNENAETIVVKFKNEPLNGFSTEEMNISSVKTIYPIKKGAPIFCNIDVWHFKRIYNIIENGLYIYNDNKNIICWSLFDKDNYDIPEEIINNSVKYEFAMTSASQFKKQTAIFVLSSKKHTPENIEKYQTGISYDLSKDSGADVLLDEISMFSWSKNLRGKISVPNKVLAYLSLCLSNTTSVKTNLRIKHIGEIKLKVTDEIINKLINCYGKEFVNSLKFEKDENDNITNYIHYKNKKWDGQGLIRASKAKEILSKQNKKYKDKNLYYFVGMSCIQRLIPGCKGLLYVVHDDEFDNAIDRDGNHVYKDYDVILEDSNVKFLCNDMFINENDFEFVRWSKTNKFSHNMSYGYWLALDENNEEIINHFVDRIFDKIYDSLNDTTKCKAYLSMLSTECEELEEQGIHLEEDNLNTIFNKLLSINSNILFDPLMRSHIKWIFRSELEKAMVCTIPTEGACRFIVSDPTAFFITENMVPRLNKDGNIEKGLNNQDLYDIIIDDVNLLSLRNADEIFWRNTTDKGVAFRPPCYHAGQVPTVQFINNLPEYVESNNRKIMTKNLFDITYWKGDVYVLNAIGMMLEAMSGADTDGDQIFVTTNKDIVKMRSKERMFNIPEDINSKKIEIEASVENFRNYFKNNLKLNKVGIFSNQMTVLGDLSGHIKTLNQNIGLPVAMLKTLEIAAYKVNIALYKVSDYGYSFNSYDDNEKIELNNMKEFANIFNSIKIPNTNKTLKDLINIQIYKSIYSNYNILGHLEKEDFEKFKTAVYKYAEASRNILASLQMQEIDSAKTGLPVDLHKYPFLSNIQDCKIKNKTVKLNYYPTWFLFLRKRSTKIAGAYTSNSIPGRIFVKVNEESKKIDDILKKNITKEGQPINIKRIITTDLRNNFSDITSSIRNIIEYYSEKRIEFNKEKKELLFHITDMSEREMIESTIKEKEYLLCEECNNILHFLSDINKISIDTITNIIYNICVESIDGFYKRGFLMSVWKNEFLIYVTEHKNNTKILLYRARLLPEYNHDNFKAAPVIITDKIIYFNGIELGTAMLKDGEYLLNTMKNTHYIVKEQEHDFSKEVLNEKFNTRIYFNDKNDISEKEIYTFKPIKENNKIISAIYNQNNKRVAELMYYGYMPEYNNVNFSFSINSMKGKTAIISATINNETDINTNKTVFDNEKYYLSPFIEQDKSLYDGKRINISITNMIKYANILKDISCYIHICKNEKEGIILSNMFYVKNESDKAIDLLKKMNKQYKIA